MSDLYFMCKTRLIWVLTCIRQPETHWKIKLDQVKYTEITKNRIFSPVLNVIQHGLSGTMYHQISKECQHFVYETFNLPSIAYHIVQFLDSSG